MAKAFDYTNPFSNNANMASGPGTCPQGEVWDDGSQSCIPDGSGGSGECPEGQIRDGNGICVPDPGSATPTPTEGPGNCPNGKIWHGPAQKCIDPCPLGYAPNGQGNCIELFPGATPTATGGCDPGQVWNQALGRCVDDPNVGGNQPTSGGGGSSGGGGGGGTLAPPPENPYTDWEKQLWETYNKLFNGASVAPPYTTGVIARLEGKLKSAGEANKAGNKQSYLAQRSAMGLGATGRTSQGLRNINNEADQRTSTGAIDINHTAIRANYDAEVSNIQRKVQILDSQTQFAMGLASNAIQRQSIQYNYTIQRMQIANQLEMLKLQLLAQLGTK